MLGSPPPGLGRPEILFPQRSGITDRPPQLCLQGGQVREILPETDAGPSPLHKTPCRQVPPHSAEHRFLFRPRLVAHVPRKLEWRVLPHSSIPPPQAGADNGRLRFVELRGLAPELMVSASVGRAVVLPLHCRKRIAPHHLRLRYMGRQLAGQADTQTVL